MVDDLDALRRGGRIPRGVASVGSMLKVKPMLSFDQEGRLQMMGAGRGRNKAITRMSDFYVEHHDDAIAGATVSIVRRLAPRVPTLGVCLGHQAMVEAFGGEIGAAKRLVHGKASPVRHDGRGIFAGLPEEFDAGRYHSLAATSVPDELEVSATCLEGEVMGVRHRELPVDGVQFHPESVLTPVGPALAKNFLEASA
jgi:anthranilate synthase component 2